jgi:hypothetical protein
MPVAQSRLAATDEGNALVPCGEAVLIDVQEIRRRMKRHDPEE